MSKKKYSILLILDNVIKKNIKISLLCGCKGSGFFFIVAYCFLQEKMDTKFLLKQINKEKEELLRKDSDC